jgi:hypothetical protein
MDLDGFYLEVPHEWSRRSRGNEYAIEAEAEEEAAQATAGCEPLQTPKSPRNLIES